MTSVVESSAEVNAATTRPGNTSRLIGVWRRRLLIGIVIAYAALLILAPLAALVSGAFAKGLAASLTALKDPAIFAAFFRTLYIALIVVTVHALFGTTLAWVLVRYRLRGRWLLNGVIDLPFAVSPVVVGYMLLLLFGRTGLFAPVLAALNIKVAFAVPGMILATLFVTLPFMARELMPVLEAFGVEQEQAAATLGANGWQTFWMVTFPALRWGFIYGIILTFARALGEFGAVLVIGGGIQGRTETVTLFIYRALDERQYVGAYSAALVLGLLSLVLVIGTELLRRKKRE
ncbi:MAG TPA: sulfate ABC transporter permease subunit [Anaerolineales bacterium]|nr:sulfate ABC transporter permease subunit [Anaerolineales bacterium]